MNNKIDYDSHINAISSRVNEFVARSEKISRDLEVLLKDVESFENTFCKTSVGRELNVRGILKIDVIKNIIGSSCANIRKFAVNKRRMSLAFDSMRDLANSYRSENL